MNTYNSIIDDDINVKQPVCPSRNGWMNKLQYIHSINYYEAVQILRAFSMNRGRCSWWIHNLKNYLKFIVQSHFLKQKKQHCCKYVGISMRKFWKDACHIVNIANFRIKNEESREHKEAPFISAHLSLSFGTFNLLSWVHITFVTKKL